MIPQRWFLACLLACSAVSGSAVAQDADIYDVSYIQANLVVGETTKAQVLEKFGEPTSSKAKLSSSGGASETMLYIQGGAPTAQAKKKSGKLGGMMASLRGVATDVATATGKSLSYDDRVRASRAQTQLNAADRLSDRLGPGEDAAASSGASATLRIQLNNGVVSSFDMQ